MAFFEQTIEEPACEVSFETTPNAISSTSIDQGSKAITNLEIGLTESENVNLRISDSQCKLSLPGFPVDRPWLPPKALLIIDRIKRGQFRKMTLLL